MHADRRHSFPALTLALAALLPLAACDASGRGGDSVFPDLKRPGGNSDGGGPGDDGSIDPNGPGPDTCQEQKFAPTKVGDPDIVLLMDRSGSMSDGSPTKWSQATTAVTGTITQLEAQKSPIYWGLYFFPSNNDCAVGTNPDVPIGPLQASAITTAIKAKSPGGNTPIAQAVTNATNYYSSVNDGRGHYLAVATDGEPNCDSGGGLPKQCTKDADCAMGETCQVLVGFGFCVPAGGEGPTTKAIAAARMKGIRTFVIGISLSGTSATLNKMAEEGGTARVGTVKYYPVSDQAQLEMALKNITSQIISCSFQLSSLPQSNMEVYVTVGGLVVKRDTTHMNGWDIDTMSKTLTFYGNACTSLQANPSSVSVGYTCPPPG